MEQLATLQSRQLNQADLDLLPNLIEVQTESYRWFIEDGLGELFRNFSPVEDYTGILALEFLDYRLDEPKRTLQECRDADITYEQPIYAKVRLVNRETGEIKETELYMGELAKMTPDGTFLINGAERVVINQLARSPSVYFRDSIDSAGRVLYSAQIIPAEGAWVEISQASSGSISVKTGQTRKFAVTTLLRALDWFDDPEESGLPPTGTDAEILEYFGEHHRAVVNDMVDSFTQREEIGMPGLEVYQAYYALDQITDSVGNVVVDEYEYISESIANKLQEIGRKQVRVLTVPYEIHETLEDDDTHSAEEGLLDVYRKMHPGDPPTIESAESLISSYFFDIKRYDLSRVGRYKINQKLAHQIDESVRHLTRADLLGILDYITGLVRGEGQVDDIDHLQNKRVRAVGEQLQTQLRTGFFRMERVARERMTNQEPEEMVPASVISIKPITAAINSFFGSGQLSQFMDQINPLAELAHKRRLSALGPGGLSKQSAKLEVRDVHHSHYGRICPIQTPEGPNVGLIGYLALHAQVNDMGFIETPYYKVENGRVTEEVEYLDAAEEEQYYIATSAEPIDEDGKFIPDEIVVRHGESFPRVSAKEVNYRDVSACQIFSVATALIPFLENDDAVRALAGSNMQRQAVPLLGAEAPLIKTGIESVAAHYSGALLMAQQDGTVRQVDSEQIVIEYGDGSEERFPLKKFVRTNMGTCINQRPVVGEGEKVKAGQILADGASTDRGELALGRNLTVAFMPFEGYNYEDAILVSERLVLEDVLTSIHIERYECEARDTKLGAEEITPDIPNVGEDALKDLDEIGVVRMGAEIRTGDIIVGKVAPKGQSELTAEEKLVIAIFGKKAEEMRDVSLRVPHGEGGIVIGIRVFSRYRYQCRKCEADYGFGLKPDRLECPRCGGGLKKLSPDQLKPGVNQMVQVFVAQRRKVMIGDKMTGRHGNKGVISKILPAEDMPYLADGTPVDICLNPLSVPSRMNIGQVFETHLGYAAGHLGRGFVCPVFDGYSAEEIHLAMASVQHLLRYNMLADYAYYELNRFEPVIDLDGFESDSIEQLQAEITRQLGQYDKEQLAPLAEWLAIDSDTWEKATEKRVAQLLTDIATERAWQRVQFDPETGRSVLYDGRTGEAFNQPVTVGSMYMMKLHHLAEDKIHARSTGPYSLITQQPLGGKAQMGGQRFGEMEVWALEAYGAAHILQEMLTVKSDDVQGRVETYEAIVKNENINEPGIPESFKILVREMQSLALDVRVEDEEGQVVDLTSDGRSLR